ncbi:hypothetical protein [Pseudomonas sp.]|uniref:hypothetical protein n=1 Tax=Pseudomonas sp. TaxID=306 RepID=UPI00258D8B43|nr:hypothetical protein [Pseudomonas sp.]
MSNKTEARHAAVKALHDIMEAVPSASLYSLAEAVLSAGYNKKGDDFVLIEGMYFSHAEILEWREEACTTAPDAVVSVIGTVSGGDVSHNTVTVTVDGVVPSKLWTMGEPVTLIHGPLISEGTIPACDVPPDGWCCSREMGHEGPCAASPVQLEQLRVELDSYVARLQAERKRLLALLKKIDQTPMGRWFHEHLDQDVTEAVRFLERSPQQLTYFSSQSTNCAGCSKHKHTPLRVDAMGGYVCLTCIYNELDRLLIEESARHAEPDWEGAREISDLPHIHDMLGDFSADPTEDNAISVVQAIVMATTRKPAQ